VKTTEIIYSVYIIPYFRTPARCK